MFEGASITCKERIDLPIGDPEMFKKRLIAILVSSLALSSCSGWGPGLAYEEDKPSEGGSLTDGLLLLAALYAVYLVEIGSFADSKTPPE